MAAAILAHPCPLAAPDIRALRSRALLELLATRYAGIDLVAARAELDRRLAAAGAGAVAPYQVLESSVTDKQHPAHMAANEKTLRQARRDVSAKILAATE